MTTIRDLIDQLEAWVDDGVPEDAEVFTSREGELIPVALVEYDIGTVILR